MGNKVLQLSGDIRMSLRATNGTLTPVNPDPTDPFNNLPVEANAALFTYKAGETRTVTSRRRPPRNGAVLFSRQDPGINSMSLTLVAIPGAILARMFYGELAVTEVEAGLVTATPITVTAKGVPLKLPHRYLTDAAFTLTDNATPTPATLVLDTDYTVDRRRGEITILTGSTVAVDDVVLATYTKIEYRLLEIIGGSKPEQDFYLHGDMYNDAADEDGELEVFQATMSKDGDVDLFSLEPLTVTISGPLITPEGAPGAYIWRSFEKS